MSRPPGAPADHLVDAVQAARTGSRFERHFVADDLPRVLEAGAGRSSQLTAVLGFMQLEKHAAIDGELTGEVWLQCQRCLQPAAIALQERFQVVLVEDESASAEEFGAYEPVATDATRLDLRWLAEEQALLALPLVPMHSPGECIATQVSGSDTDEEPARQKPFGNLRELLQKH